MIILHQKGGIERNDAEFGRENRSFGRESYKPKEIGLSSHGIEGASGQQSRIWRDKTPMEQDVPSAIHHSKRRIHKPISPTSYNIYISNFSRWSRMEFLRFSGEDLRSWLFKIEQFFSMENVTNEEKVSFVALKLEGEATQWHLSFMRYMQYLQPATWTEYVMAMVDRFGTNFYDPLEEIKKIKQVGSMKEYQAMFERHLTRVKLSQENAISCFIMGLKSKLNIAVKITSPISFSKAYKCVRLEEAYLAAIRQPTGLQSYNSSSRISDHIM
ncbi:hypothetical protein KY284_030381 [Solanum tuberosum]|nr:hypothetical protein KY284_030381 [Solanum tuberosum]